MSFLAPPTPNNANRRTMSQQPVASNVLGTPWPTLWGVRDLPGTLVAWTNHTFDSGGASGKGGGQVSAGEKDFRTFALGLCIGPVDRITQVMYDNQIIWEGNITIASAATQATSTVGVGGVILTAATGAGQGNTRGTIAFYFGVDTQTQDPMLAQFIPNAPFYRGMCYAVFHGPRPGTQGFRIGNADTLAQIAVRVEREPAAPPGSPFTFTEVDGPNNAAAEAQTITVTGNVTNFTGGKNVLYDLGASKGPDDAHLNVAWGVIDGFDPLGYILTGFGDANANGTYFATTSAQGNPAWTNALGYWLLYGPTTLTAWGGIVLSNSSDETVTPRYVCSLLDPTAGVWSVQAGAAPAGTAVYPGGMGWSAQNGVPFAVGSLGLMVTLSWASNTSPPLNPAVGFASWSILVASESAEMAGANVSGMIYELLTSDVHGYNLNPAILDTAAFLSFVSGTDYVGLNYVVNEKSDARGLITEILKNVQGALTISNGLLGPRLMGNGNDTIQLTLQADDVLHDGVKQRPGAWYEIPQHVTVKFRDINRLFRDTTLSLPGAGDFGDDEKAVELDLPMVTDAATAKLVGTRLAMLLTLPKTPDVIPCSRAAFAVQFGDVIAINDPTLKYGSQTPLVVLQVQEMGVGDETILLSIVPSLFGSLPISKQVVGGGGSGFSGPGQAYNSIQTQDAWELPYEFAPDGSKRFTVFAAREDPDAQAFSLWASDETPPVDYTDVDDDAMFHAGGIIEDWSAPRYTMDRAAHIDFTAASNDIGGWVSLSSDNAWFAYQMLILVGSGDGAVLYAAEELLYLGNSLWRVQSLFGPLSDTIGNSFGAAEDIWFFDIMPLYNVLAQPAWVLGASITFKGIPFGSRLSPSLLSALASTATVINRSLCARAAANLNANGRGATMNPTYSGDINLAWDLCNRGYGFGTETNPCEFDPAIASEVKTCAVNFYNGSTHLRYDTAAVRTAVQTSVVAAVSAAVFSVASTSGLQPGDRISVVHAGGEWFGRILSISGSTITLVSPLSIVPSSSDVVNRYEAAGYIYPQATIQSDNGGTLPASVLCNVQPILNGLPALRPVQLTVTKI